MASFDFIDASVKGYEFVWNQRSYLARVALPVLFVKIACYLGIFVLGIPDDYLLQGLVLIPAFIVEALFCVGIIRYMLYGEPIFIWGKVVAMPEGEGDAAPYNGYYSRQQCYQGGIAMFLLIEILLMLSASLLNMPREVVDTGEASVYPAGVYVLNIFIMFGILSAFVWGIRLVWLYIPIAMGIPLKAFLKLVKGFQFSFSAILVSLICFLPLLTALLLFILVSYGVFGDNSANGIIVRYAVVSVVELIVVAIQTVAMVHGIRQIVYRDIKKD